MIFPSSTVLCIILSVTASVRAISILNGEYETTTDVQDYLNLALQAQAMREAEDLTTKKQFYTQVGANYYTRIIESQLVLIYTAFPFRASIHPPIPLRSHCNH